MGHAFRLSLKRSCSSADSAQEVDEAAPVSAVWAYNCSRSAPGIDLGSAVFVVNLSVRLQSGCWIGRFAPTWRGVNRALP